MQNNNNKFSYRRHQYLLLSSLSININDYICWFNRFWVPDYLQLAIIRDVHNQIVINHLGYQEIIILIAQNYYCSELKKIVQHYIQNCYSYRHVKALKDWYNVLLKLLPIFFYLWIDIIPEFIINLPIGNGYNAILIVVDYLK